MAVITIGTLLLMLPFSHNKDISFVDALFTATSATCVTGLLVADISKDFTFMGQLIILLLIQIGGLGYMTLATFIAVFIKRKLTHRDQLILKASLGYDTLSGIVRFLKNVFMVVFIIELVGAVILSVRFSFDMGVLKAVWFGIFHSISAFNNAGFSLFRNNLMDYELDFVINMTMAVLIVLGGIGYFVILELFYFKKNMLTRISTHSKVALSTTLILLVGGALLFMTLEWNNPKTIGDLNAAGKIFVSMFQSITLRTAGIKTIDYSQITDSTVFLSTIFMIIGASPGGTGGGIKTTTFAVIALTMWHTLRDHPYPYVFKRSIPAWISNKSVMLLLVASFYIIAASVLLAEVERQPFLHMLFEVSSAFGTVGLSIGNGQMLSLSALFSDFGKSVIILMMIFGRVGTLAITVLLVGKMTEKRFIYAEGRIML